MSCQACRDLGYMLAGDVVVGCSECEAGIDVQQVDAAKVLEQPVGVEATLKSFLAGNQEFRRLATPYLIEPGEPIGLRVEPEPLEFVEGELQPDVEVLQRAAAKELDPDRRREATGKAIEDYFSGPKAAAAVARTLRGR